MPVQPYQNIIEKTLLVKKIQISVLTVINQFSGQARYVCCYLYVTDECNDVTICSHPGHSI